MDSKNSGENNPKEKENYERASYLLARRQWNISYPLNVGLVIFGALAAAGVLLQSIYIGQTLTETRAEFKAAQRAYVNFGSRTGVVAEFDPTAKVDGKQIIILHFTNGGQSTARHLAIQIHTSAENKNFGFTHRHRYTALGGIMTQGGVGETDLAAQAERTEYISSAQLLWSPEELKETETRKHIFWIQGEIAYCDIFGTYHCQPFATQYIATIGKFGPWMILPNCYIEPGQEMSFQLSVGLVQYKEIEPCEQPNEPEYYAELRPSPISTATTTP